MVSRETIVNFLEGKGSREEVQAVERWLADNPDGLKEYISEAEWDAFEPVQSLQPEASERFWQRVDKNTRRPLSIVFLKRAVAAAAVLLAACAGWYLLAPKQTTDTPAVASVPVMKELFNSSTRDTTFRLSDSTLVVLQPQSTLRYPEHFAAAERTVGLTGMAAFTVSNAAKHPFVVHSDSVLVTVLGTRFTVAAWPNEVDLTVNLYQGRVMISTTGRPFKGAQRLFYLQPGDVFTLNKVTREVAVSNHRNAHVTPANATNSNRGIQGDNWYMFNNQPLADVLDQLQQLFNTPIRYNSADVKGMTFIGKVDRTDSLENILNTIVLLNNLKLQKEDKGYVISNQ